VDVLQQCYKDLKFSGKFDFALFAARKIKLS
jgi:hypothetical protein